MRRRCLSSTGLSLATSGSTICQSDASERSDPEAAATAGCAEDDEDIIEGKFVDSYELRFSDQRTGIQGRQNE